MYSKKPDQTNDFLTIRFMNPKSNAQENIEIANLHNENFLFFNK